MENSEHTELAVTGRQAAQSPRGALTDLRSAFMSLPSDQMSVGLAEYEERRFTFRSWLQRQLVEDVHFGFPPGCSQETKKGWQAKPSLYKAGADFLCDLMGSRDEYESDVGGWRQLGEPAGTFVYRCRLVSRSTGELLGEGIGAFKIGEKKGMQENAAVKMACKRAKTAAVINAWGLSDLFTQDLEDGDLSPPRHDNPNRDASAPKAATRGERRKAKEAAEPEWVSKEECVALFNDFGCVDQSGDARKAFPEFVFKSTGMSFDVFTPSRWTRGAYKLVKDSLAKLSGDPSAEG